MDIEKHAAVIFGNMKKHLTNKYMKKLLIRLSEFWYFHVQNPVVRKGESKDGAFKWTFRRFDLTIETLSGNFKARFTADEHPFAALLSGESDKNTPGFAEILYTVGMLLTTEQKFANDIQNAIKRYQDRMMKSAKVDEDKIEEKIALETEKQIQELVEMPKKERRKMERGINRRFKKAVKAQNLQETE